MEEALYLPHHNQLHVHMMVHCIMRENQNMKTIKLPCSQA